MNIDTETIQDRCTDPVFERGQTYRREGRIQQLERFDDLVSAVVSGSNPYDVTIKFGGRTLETQCTCPYDGHGDCKHVVAVLLAIADDPPEDESERIEALLADVTVEELRAFVRDVLATHSTVREQFLAQFGDEHKSVGEYREEIGRLFEQHADPVVFEAIDFSRFFNIAEQYRERDRYLAAATVYRAVFEEVDENFGRVAEPFRLCSLPIGISTYRTSATLLEGRALGARQLEGVSDQQPVNTTVDSKRL